MEDKITGLILVCTGKYDVFLQSLLDSANRYLLSTHCIDIYLFADNNYPLSVSNRMTLHRFEVPHLPFPYPTLYRYKWITQYSSSLTAKNLYYCDVDMLFVNTVGEEILPDETGLVATRHPGFYHGGWGDYKTPEWSAAYIESSKRHDYYAGGFQGGSRVAFLMAAQIMSNNIDADLEHGVIAQWNDESHWNCYLKRHPHKVLSPEYCMVEQVELRRKWGIDNLTPRLIALKKDHKEIRL